jgi:hypothetical protein
MRSSIFLIFLVCTFLDSSLFSKFSINWSNQTNLKRKKRLMGQFCGVGGSWKRRKIRIAVREEIWAKKGNFQRVPSRVPSTPPYSTQVLGTHPGKSSKVRKSAE